MCKKTEIEISQWIDEPLRDYSNRLYHQNKLLGQMNILSGNIALKELKNAIIHKIDDNDFVQAINILCRIVSIRQFPDAFYDNFSYEKLTPRDIRYRLTKFLKDNEQSQVSERA